MGCYSPEHSPLLRENGLDCLAYASCVTFLLFVLRAILFPPVAHCKHNTSQTDKTKNGLLKFIIKHKKPIFLFLYALILFTLASTFYLRPIFERISVIGSWRPYEEDKTRLWRPSPLVKPPFLINDALACILLEYLVYLSWHDNAYVIGSTVVLLFIRLIGTPLIFETVTLILSITRFIHYLRTAHHPSPPPSDSQLSSSPKYHTPLLILTLILSSIFAILAYLDMILHLTGTVRPYSKTDLHHMVFWDSVMFYGAFLVQAIMIMYWAEGGPMLKKELDDQPIRLPPNDNENDTVIIGAGPQVPVRQQA